MVKPSILIIEKAADLRNRLVRRLRMAGCEVLTAEDGPRGIQAAADSAPDIVLLGLDLPDADSLEICRTIRQQRRPGQDPVFVLTPAQGAIADSNLDGSHREGPETVANHVDHGCSALLAWLQAAGGPLDQVIRWGDLELDRRRHQATVAGRPLGLTATQFRLMWTMSAEPGKVFSRAALARHCTGRSGTNARTVDVHIKAIRSKLADRADIIETVHRLGYRLRALDDGWSVEDPSDFGANTVAKTHAKT
jgi:DNA-binding response OmpR family regulator